MSNDMEVVKGKRVWLRDLPGKDEVWLRKQIVDDPSILGLGDLIVKDMERMQPKAGRLDLLLQDDEERKRFEVEIMLGTMDESHIIRCIEYWDIERKRYPNHEHVAVLVAEEITTRFHNIVSLFNRTIPIIAIELHAIQHENKLLLHFVKVLDELGWSDQGDEEMSEREMTDRSFWEKRATPESLLIFTTKGPPFSTSMPPRGTPLTGLS